MTITAVHDVLFITWNLRFAMSDFDAETDKILAAYNLFFDSVISPCDITERFIANIDLTFFALDANGKLQFFHSPMKFGKNIRKQLTSYATFEDSQPMLPVSSCLSFCPPMTSTSEHLWSMHSNEKRSLYVYHDAIYQLYTSQK